MNIKEIDIHKDLQAYEMLCKKQGASVFNSPKWLAMYGNKVKVYGIYNNNSELVGSFFLYHTKKKTFKVDICPPFSANNGLFFENRAESNPNIHSAVKHVLESLIDFFETINSDLLVFTLPASVNDSQPFTWKKYEVKVKYTYHIDLALSQESLLANLSSEKRKSLNRAQKDELEIKRESDMNVVKKMIMKTFSRNQVSKNLNYFDKILFEYATPENSMAFVAYDKGVPIAATFCVYDNTTAYYLFGGYDSNQKHHGAGVSCMWNSILKAKELGLKIFDFEGSMLPEVEKYFREFGGVLVPYYTAYKAKPLMNVLMKMKDLNI